MCNMGIFYKTNKCQRYRLKILIELLKFKDPYNTG